MSSDVKWTPEPWVARTFLIVAPNAGSGQYGGLEVTHTGLVGRNKPGEQAEADAARIVACVNGCRGLNPAAYRDVVEAAKAARTELAFCVHVAGRTGGKYEQALNILDAALAKASEGNHAE